MFYCETSDNTPRCRPTLPGQTNRFVYHQAGRCKQVLKAMVTPEKTAIPKGVPENRWFSAAKTLFWVANAIIIGIILARVCS